jgi:hypothetical protein
VGFFDIVAYLATSASIRNWKLPNPILYEGAMSFLSDVVALLGGWLLAATTFVFSSSLWPSVLTVGFFYIIAKLAMSASISNLKLPNPILYEGAMSFFSDAVALLAGWFVAASTFVFSSSLWP